MVVVSLGAEGALLASGGRVCHAVAPPQPAENTVGSGDCLLAGVAVGLARGLALDEVLRLGVACGTANTMSAEHGYVKREHVDAMLPRVRASWLGGARVTGRYRWWIGTLLFLSTVVNYLDRQTLSVLAPHLKSEFQWTNQDFAWIVIAFRLSYTVMQAVSGRLLDRFGTRNGLSLAVLWYSTIAMLTAGACGFASFCGLRFLLGAGEAANWPAATKAVSEWFPRRERGWAVALFDSGSSVGAALATVIVPLLYLYFGSWRPAFLITGALGFVWLILWRRHYHPPDVHPRLGEAERRRSSPTARRSAPGAPPQTQETVPSARCCGCRQTWGAIASRGLTDPVWFMITDWFAIYLVSKGFDLEQTAVGFWVPFLAADLGNFFGGGVSSWLIRRGWSVGRARRTLIVAGGFGVLALIPAAFLSEITRPRRLLRDRHLLVRGDVHDGAVAPRRPLREPRGGIGGRAFRRRRGRGHADLDAPHRRRGRSLLVPADPDHRQPGPAGRGRARGRARPQHRRVRPRPAEGDLIPHAPIPAGRACSSSRPRRSSGRSSTPRAQRRLSRPFRWSRSGARTLDARARRGAGRRGRAGDDLGQPALRRRRPPARAARAHGRALRRAR